MELKNVPYQNVPSAFTLLEMICLVMLDLPNHLLALLAFNALFMVSSITYDDDDDIPYAVPPKI